MKRWLEVPLIISVVVATVLGTASVLRDRAGASENPVDQFVKQRVSQWIGWGKENSSRPGGREAGQPAGGAVPTQSPASVPDSTTSVPDGAIPSVHMSGPSWTAADTRQLEALLADLQQNMTPADWDTVAQALRQDPTQAATTIWQVLNRKLPAGDLKWLEQTASNPAQWAADIQLLQQSAAELMGNLTPDERAWLLDAWNHWQQQKNTDGGL